MKKYLKALLFAIIILLAAFFVFSFFNRDYALKVDNERISLAEFETYLYEQKIIFEQKGGEDIWETDFDGIGAEEVAKQNAINSIIMVKTALRHAPELGITLSDEEEKELKQKGEQYLNKMKKDAPKIDLSLKQAEKIIKESVIQNKVYDFLTNGFEISDADFESYFNKYYEENKKELNDVKIRYIFKKISQSDDNSEAVFNEVNDIYEKVLLGEDFSQLQNKYSDDDQKDVVDVKNSTISPEALEASYNLSQGEVSEIIYTKSGFYIIKAQEVLTPDMKKLKEDVLQTYIKEKKQEIYNEQIKKWSENTSVSKNENVWNLIKIKEI